MKLIIDIPEEQYRTLNAKTQEEVVAVIDNKVITTAVKNGTPLSESEDCISRQAMHIELEKWITYGEYKYSNATKYLYDRIDRLPPVKPAEKVGYWVGIDEEPHEDYECNKCGYVVSTFTANIEPHTEYKYCPNCGAKMQEVEE